MAYVTEYADTEIIPKLLRMFSLDQSETVPMVIFLCLIGIEKND